MTRRGFLRGLAQLAIFGGAALTGYGYLRRETERDRVTRLALIPTLSPMPTPVTRADWNARAPNHAALNEFGFSSDANPEGWHVYSENLVDIYRTVAVHHSASGMRGTTMNTMQNLHMDQRLWADIGYHFGIDRDGTIYTGRDIGVRGASVAGHNTGTIGVVVMGNFNTEQPTAPQVIALQTLVNHLAEAYQLTHVAGHREFNGNTTCPGDRMMHLLDFLAAGAGLRRGTDGYVPPSPTPTEPTACACCDLTV